MKPFALSGLEVLRGAVRRAARAFGSANSTRETSMPTKWELREEGLDDPADAVATLADHLARKEFG